VADPSFKRPVSSRTSFGVHHYAGEVVYTALGFCEKNKDTLQPALIELLASSQSDFVRSLVPYEHQASEQTRRKSTLLMDTLTAQFKMQLNKLVFVINSTSPHYVRCVNPNSEKTAGKIDRPCVLLQVQRPTSNT
jgi:myosin-5